MSCQSSILVATKMPNSIERPPASRDHAGSRMEFQAGSSLGATISWPSALRAPIAEARERALAGHPRNLALRSRPTEQIRPAAHDVLDLAGQVEMRLLV